MPILGKHSRSSSECSSELEQRRGPKKRPETASEWFEKMANDAVRCGALPTSLSTFDSLGVKTVHLWPTLLSRRDPISTDLLTVDGEEGDLISGFRRVAKRAFSTGPKHELPVTNRWTDERIEELTYMFRDVARAYIHHAVDPALSTEMNCKLFYQSIESLLAAAHAKACQLSSDLLYKVSGKTAARAFKASMIINEREFPTSMKTVIKLAQKGAGHSFFGGIENDEPRSMPFRGDRGGFRGGRGAAGRGGQGGRGGYHPMHVPGICSRCGANFTGHISTHLPSCPKK